MTKKLACIQSNYIPWKGYFDIINTVDEFVIYDDVQYTKNDWRNRNRIKTQNGIKWLTIPVSVSNKFGQLIKDAKVVNHKWARKHWLTIEQSYRRSPYFAEYKDTFASLYAQCKDEDYLSKINFSFISQICNILGVKAPLTWSMDYQLLERDPNRRLIELCKKANADVYISGPAAKDYLNLQLWEDENIKVEFFLYDGYLEYPQLFPPFEHYVSILDMLFNMGEEAKECLLSNTRKKTNEKK